MKRLWWSGIALVVGVLGLALVRTETDIKSLIITPTPGLTPFAVRDFYGSNLLSVVPAAGGTNYWTLFLGSLTPVEGTVPLSANISDVIISTGLNSYFQVKFGSSTNSFWAFGSEFEWGDPTGSSNPLFDRQARFFPQHIESNPVNIGNPPTVAIGLGAGSGGSPSVAIDSSGTDVAQTITLTTGTGPSVGVLFTNTFQLNYASAPHVIFCAANTNASGQATNSIYISSVSVSNFVVSASPALTASKVYVWNFHVIQ